MKKMKNPINLAKVSKLIELALNAADYPKTQKCVAEPNFAFCLKFAELIVKDCGIVADELAGGQYGGCTSIDLFKHFSD